jgi:hypothetical protein
MTLILLRVRRLRSVELLGVAHGHDAHAVGAVVGLDDDEGLFVDAVFLVLAAHLGQQRVGRWSARTPARCSRKVDLAAAG